MDREKVIERLEKVWDAFNHMEHELYADYVFDALALLKEQESWINEIAEYQQSISGSGMHELDDYEKGEWDGLQIAWNIISEGR